jgi:hypothetical protein
LVTGASKGLGAAYAEELARQRSNFVLTARSLSLLNELAEQIRESYGVKVKVFQADISFKETGDDAR